MSREWTAPAPQGDSAALRSAKGTTTAAAVGGLLQDKEDIIVAQARRIADLEREAERVRKDRDSLATKLTLLTYKLEMYSKDLHDGRRQPPTMNPTDPNQASHR